MATKTAELKLEQRRERIAKIAATDYHSSDDAAQDYLETLDGATLDQQKKLFADILQLHNAVIEKHHACPGEKSLKPDVWKPIAKRMGDTVDNWVRRALGSNASVEVTANELWDRLLEHNGNDRVVALGLLLSHLAPYAQMNYDLTILQPADAYEKAHQRVLEPIALLRRVERNDVTIPEVAEATVRLMEKMGDDHVARVAFMLDFLKHMAKALGSRKGTCEIVMVGPFPFPLSADEEAKDKAKKATQN